MAYPVLPLVLFYNNSISYKADSHREEFGKGGIIGRTKIQAINPVKAKYSVQATVKDRDTLQNFLIANRGLPFQFKFDGTTNVGLYICRSWSWSWLVYAEGNGVWQFTGELEQVFRPGFKVGSTLTIPVGVARGRGNNITLTNRSIQIPSGAASGSGNDVILSRPNSIIIDSGVATGSGNDVVVTGGTSNLSIPSGVAQGSGNDVVLTEPVPSITIPSGAAEGTGNNVTLVPATVSLIILSGAGVGSGNDVTLKSPLNIPSGIARGSGNDVVLIPGTANLVIPTGNGRGAGNDVVVSGPSTLLNNLIAWFSMDETSGNLADSHTSGISLTRTGTTTSITGKQSNAVELGSKTTVLSGSNDGRFAPNQWHFAFWAKPNLGFSDSTYGNQTITVVDGLTSTTRAFRSVWLANSANGANQYSLQLSVWSPNAASVTTLTTTAKMNTSDWYFLEFQFDGTNLGVAVNGAAFETTPAGFTEMNDSTTNLRIGYYNASYNAFGGAIDEFAMWNRTLTSTERTALYNAGSGISYPG